MCRGGHICEKLVGGVQRLAEKASSRLRRRNSEFVTRGRPLSGKRPDQVRLVAHRTQITQSGRGGADSVLVVVEGLTGALELLLPARVFWYFVCRRASAKLGC